MALCTDIYTAWESWKYRIRWDYGGIMGDMGGLWGIKGDYGVVGVWDYGLRELCDFLTWLCLPSGSPGSTGLGGIMGD